MTLSISNAKDIWPHRDCSASFAACKKCAERHDTKECTSEVLKCVNCSGSHQSGHKTCTEQVKPAERYKNFDRRRLIAVRLSYLKTLMFQPFSNVFRSTYVTHLVLHHPFLSQIILDLDVDVVLIQEPHVFPSFSLWLQYPPWFLGF